jgi:hypothetical protein
MKIPKLTFLLVLFGSVLVGMSATVTPLAQDHVVVGESPDPQHIPLYTPSILRLASGRLIAAYEQGGEQRLKGEPWAFILTSEDHGKTWQQRGRATVTHGRLFVAGNAVYYLGHSAVLVGRRPEDRSGDLRILRSEDAGTTWGEAADLTHGQKWHQSAANVWHARGNVYLVMERRVSDAIAGWFVGELAPVLMRAKETADLTQAGSWTFASELDFAQLIPGYRSNQLGVEFFGVPFFPSAFPAGLAVGGDRMSAPLGWLETNVVQIKDPNHYWHDPNGHTFHLFMRAHTGGTGYAAMAKVVEQPDGSMRTELESVPSGKKILWVPMPGGHMRFHITYDPQTKFYWLLSSQPTDSMTRAERLPAERYGLPNNERHRLVLHFSRNMVDWCFAGVVAMGATPNESRHYASMDIDGDDLVILSRSGDARAKSAHDGNLITFHRVNNFRELVY